MNNKRLDEMNSDELRASLKKLMSMVQECMEEKKVAEIAVVLLAKKLGEEPMQLMRDAKRLSEDSLAVMSLFIETLISELGLTVIPMEDE